MDPEKVRVIYTEQQVNARTKEIAEGLRDTYFADKSEEVLCVCVLKGGVFFFTRLLECLQGENIVCDFIRLSSYGDSTATSGTVKKAMGGSVSVKDRKVLIVEDIVDSGLTLKYLKSLYKDEGAKEVFVVSLLDKPVARQKGGENPDIAAFTLSGAPFIVGLGLDYAEKYRELGGIYELLDTSK